MKVTIQNLKGETERISLPNPIFSGSEKYGTGVTLESIFYGPRTGRMVLETYSIWEDRRTHGVEGARFYEVDESEFLRACELADIDPPIDGNEL